MWWDWRLWWVMVTSFSDSKAQIRGRLLDKAVWLEGVRYLSQKYSAGFSFFLLT